jgi:hypothetical protein
MGHAAIPLIGRKARKPLVGMEPLRRREQRRPYLEGQAAVRARWMVTVRDHASDPYRCRNV